jgi:hypothetical protein
MIELDNKLTVNSFQTSIETSVHKKGMGYLEAIMMFCEDTGVEIEAVITLVRKSDVIRAKLEAECENLNLVNRQPKLPI